MLRVLTVVVLAIVALSSATPHSHGGGGETLHFKVSARDLTLSRVFTEKPFVKISAQDDNANDEYHVGETDVIEQTNDPDFPNVFKFKYDPSAHQRWHFKVRGSEAVDDDAHIGEAWVTVSDYVDHDEYMQVNLSHKGYLIIKRA